MKTFLGYDFLLESDVAMDLFHRVAKDLPIVDYHCHLSPQQMASDHRFRSITEIWLEGDHYKWRAMGTNGEAERYCTGDAPDREKFEAWARTVPHTLRNPLYHWTAMELKRPFGVTKLLSPGNAREIYEHCNARLEEDGFTTMGLLAGFRVAVACTTDDPTDSLEPHQALARRPDPLTRVYPTWRPDKALAVEDPAAFNAWVGKLERAAGREVSSWSSFLEALDARHAAFHERGCRASDHGLEHLYAEPWADAEVAPSFGRLRAGNAMELGEGLRYKSALLHRLALLDHARGWAQQFHLGALRNNSTRLR